MKKFYLTLTAVLALFGFAVSQPCTVNPSAQTTEGVNPTADNLPCIVRNVAYDQTLQGKIQESKDTTIIVPVHINVDSISIDSIAGLPNGITWVKSPDVLPGGGNGCIRFTGTTSDAPGDYPIEAFGRVWFRVTSPIDTPYAYQGSLNRFSPFGDYYVTVINQGDQCHQISGINDFNSNLNSMVTVYPNPNNGTFSLYLNAGQRVNGQVIILDVAGKTVYNETIDVIGQYTSNINLSNLPKGLYTLQLRTAEGFAAKTISIE